jgi:hypothetical protein
MGVETCQESVAKSRPVHFQYGMAHVTEVSTCNNNVTLHTIRRKRWVRYSFDIAMKVKGEVCTAEGLEILLNHDLEGMLKIPNVSCRKLDNLQLQVSKPQSCIASSTQRTAVAATLRALTLPVIRLKLQQFELELIAR